MCSTNSHKGIFYRLQKQSIYSLLIYSYERVHFRLFFSSPTCFSSDSFLTKLLSILIAFLYRKTLIRPLFNQCCVSLLLRWERAKHFYRGYGIMHLAREKKKNWERQSVSERTRRKCRESRHKPQRYCVISKKMVFRILVGNKMCNKTLNGIFIEILLRN